MNNTAATKEAATFILCLWGWCVGHASDVKVVIVYLTLIIMGYQAARVVWFVIRGAWEQIRRIGNG